GGDGRVAGDHQAPGDQRADVVAALAGARNVDALQRRAVADVVGRVAVGDLPDDGARVEVNGAERAVGGLDQGQALDRERGRAAAAGAAGGRGRRGGHRIGAL